MDSPSSASAPFRVAIVILNWNGADMLRRYLPSVVAHSDEPGVEVIVADNGSTDQSVEVMRTEFPHVTLLTLDRNYGFAEGYNRALRQVEADLYLLLNSDVEIRQPHWLRPLLAHLAAHPDVAACQPKLLDLRHPERLEYAGACGGYLDRLGYPLCRGRVMGTVEEDHGQYDTTADVHWATGAALLVRADRYWQVGGLDARFFAHQEEIDLCWRLRLWGWRVSCVPASTAYHLGGASLAQGNPRKTYLNFRNNLLLLYKNLPDSALRPVLRLRRWLDALAALQFLAKGDWANFRAVRRARHDFRALRSDFQPLREQNRREAQTHAEPSLLPFSVLWQYYVRGRHRFSQLPAAKDEPLG